MTDFLFNRVLLIILLACLATTYVWAQSSDTKTPLTNAAVVKLVKAGFKDKTIVTIIASRPARFDLSPDRMIELKRSGVSERLILAMISHQEGFEFSDDFGSDDESFSNRAGSEARDPMRSGDGSSTDIFGSRGGSKGSTKSRGGNGSSSGDTITTGSATVRILRPPSESGAALKLEKSQALTNDSIMELVEAGFSEGTIIRRIEQSSVEFDLSSTHLDELRKHRVSEKILTAMKVATGEDSGTTKNPPRSDGTPKD